MIVLIAHGNSWIKTVVLIPCFASILVILPLAEELTNAYLTQRYITYQLPYLYYLYLEY